MCRFVPCQGITGRFVTPPRHASAAWFRSPLSLHQGTGAKVRQVPGSTLQQVHDHDRAARYPPPADATSGAIGQRAPQSQIAPFARPLRGHVPPFPGNSETHPLSGLVASAPSCGSVLVPRPRLGFSRTGIGWWFIGGLFGAPAFGTALYSPLPTNTERSPSSLPAANRARTRSRPWRVTIAGASALRAVMPFGVPWFGIPAANGYHVFMDRDRIDEAVLALLYLGIHELQKP